MNLSVRKLGVIIRKERRDNNMRKLPLLFSTMMTCILALALMAAPASAGGPVFLSGDDADDSGHCQGTACGGVYPKALNFVYTNSTSPGTGIVAIGANSSNALIALNSWNNVVNGGPGATITHVNTTAGIAAVNFATFKVLYIASDSSNTSGGLTLAQLTALNARQADIANFVNNLGGGLMALTEANLGSTRYAWLPVALTDISVTHDSGIKPTADLTPIAPGITTQLNHGCCYHTAFTGPVGFSGLKVLAYHDHNNNSSYDFGTDHAVILGGAQVVLTAEVCNDGIDNDGDGLVDNNDPDCHVCGDGNIDPGEQCDDGNNLNGDGCSAQCQTEAPVNNPPNAQCQDVTVPTDSGVCDAASAPVDAGSSDPDGDSITLAQSPAGPYALGPTSVTLTVTDSKGASDSCQATVTVVDQEPPGILCPAPQVVECTGPGGATASFSATASDNCSVASTSCSPASGSTFPVGTTQVDCSATDGRNSSSCSSSVTVQDTTPPTVSCVESVNPSGKNVPNAKNEDGFYKVSGSDVCSAPTIMLGSFAIANGETIKITQTPGKSGVTYVNTMGPEQIRHFQVGPGDAVITATDGSGNSSSVTCLVPPPPK